MKIGIIGDYSPEYPSHKATNEALIHSSKLLGIHVEFEWIPTASISEQKSVITQRYSGYWIAPGSPDSVPGVLQMIQYAREHDIPLLGTCGGFQNILIEYARNKLMLQHVEHEEQSPDAANLLISKLACSLVGQRGEVKINQNSKVFGIYQTPTAIEQFRCNYGLNSEYQTRIEESGLAIVGTDHLGEPRIIELPKNQFFIGTLFVPQLSSAPEAPHCLINSFIEHVMNQ